MNNITIINDLMALLDTERALQSQRYFKTGPGGYGEGDKFLGLSMPQIRKIVGSYYQSLTIADINIMLINEWHEVRVSAVVTMAKQYPKSTQKQQLYELYIKHIGKGINNWDIIDISCPHIVGTYLYDKNRQPLYYLAQKGLWHKRVAIISTFAFLRNGETQDTYNLAEILVYEQQDLLHKAVGWALREMGKKDERLLKDFLDKYAATMPRTALRYALEKMTDYDRQYYMGLGKASSKS